MREVFWCSCYMPEHHLIVEYEDDPGESDKQVFVYVLLDPSLSFWDRLRRGFGYVFRRGGCHPCYAEVLLERKELRRLIASLQTAEIAMARDRA